MEIATVDQGDFDWGTAQCFGGVEAAETAAEYQDVMHSLNLMLQPKNKIRLRRRMH